MNNEWELVIKELVEAQQRIILQLGRRLVPDVTADDVLQPNDFPALENNPHFRYEEGVLAGVLTVQMALRRLMNEKGEEASRDLSA